MLEVSQPGPAFQKEGRTDAHLGNCNLEQLASLLARRNAIDEEIAGVFLDLFPGQDARYVEASWARVWALLGDEIGNQTAAGWQTTIDLYDDAGLLEGRVTPADVLPRR